MFGRRKRLGLSRKSFTTVDEGISAPLRDLMDRPTQPPGAARAGAGGRAARLHPTVPARPSGIGTRTLVVGQKIRLNGEVASCETLRVEGRLEAEITDTQSLEIAETGYLKGSAVVAECRVLGEFEGNLTVQGQLCIGRGGRVRGAIRYADIEIESGGQISGEVQLLSPRPQAPGVPSGSRTSALGSAAPTGEPKGRRAKTGPRSEIRAPRGRNK